MPKWETKGVRAKAVDQALDDGAYLRHLVDDLSGFYTDLTRGTSLHTWSRLPEVEMRVQQVGVTGYEIFRITDRYPNSETAAKVRADAVGYHKNISRKLGIAIPDGAPRKGA